MDLVRRLQRGLGRLASRRYRRLLIAALVTVGISTALISLIGLIQWRGRSALQSDTSTAILQAGQQLVRSLQSRRGTLTFIRDTLNRRSDLSGPQLKAMAESGVQHTRHLLGVGWIQREALPVWWSGPSGLSASDRAQLDRAIIQRAQLRGVWRVPSTFIATTRTQRHLLVMLEPLRTPASGRSALVGAFDLKPLLEDFFTNTLPQRYPAQLLDGSTLLHRSAGWSLASPGEPRPVVVQHQIALDAARWTFQMQAGQTYVAQTLSWLNVLLIGLCLLAGTGLTALVWLLAARTWILQRAVARRTAALRRVLDRLRQLATTDELTGLFNRRYFLERWSWECRRAKRYERALACLLIDVNNFKQINDRCGHHIGDLVLKQIAKELAASLRHSDIVARFGGDEFIAALPETSLDQAQLVAEKLRQIEIAIPEEGAPHMLPATLSVGVGYLETGRDRPDAIIQAADQSLYATKRRHAPRPA